MNGEGLRGVGEWREREGAGEWRGRESGCMVRERRRVGAWRGSEGEWVHGEGVRG